MTPIDFLVAKRRVLKKNSLILKELMTTTATKRKLSPKQGLTLTTPQTKSTAALFSTTLPHDPTLIEIQSSIGDDDVKRETKKDDVKWENSTEMLTAV